MIEFNSKSIRNPSETIATPPKTKGPIKRHDKTARHENKKKLLYKFWCFLLDGFRGLFDGLGWYVVVWTKFEKLQK